MSPISVPPHISDEARAKKGKAARLEARLSAEQKEVMQYAADIEGRSLSDFVVEKAFDAAQRVIREHDVMALSARDSRAFVEALLNPPAPNDALRAAFADYRRAVAEGAIRRA